MTTKRPTLTERLEELKIKDLKMLGLWPPKPQELSEGAQVIGIALGTFAANLVHIQQPPRSIIVANYIDDLRKKLPPEGEPLSLYGKKVKNFLIAWDEMIDAYKELPLGKEK
jgi:hypothetical protein